MNTSSDLRKKWEGRVVHDKFPLRQWLGGSDHSAVFLTERGGEGSQKAVIKLIAAEHQDENGQLARWADAAKFSHPHLIRLFESGRSVIDGTPLLYVVMEFADEDLAQILPVRPLSPAEAAEMLEPAAEALSSLHRSGWVHGAIKPSNIMAAGNQLKLSTDTLGKIGERQISRAPGGYDPPESPNGRSPAQDIWSLGITLVAVLSGNEPTVSGNRATITVPDTTPRSMREIVQGCLRDERHRCSAEDILRRLQPSPTPVAKEPGEYSPREPSRRWIVLMIVAAAIVLGVGLGIRILSHQAFGPAAQTPPVSLQPSSETAGEQSPAPFSKQAPVQQVTTPGSVLHQVMPEVSRSALNTITGRIKVSVHVAVDASGNVSQAELVSAGPSRYFADRSLAAARRWKFAPPKIGGQPTASEWLLRFHIGRVATQVFPSPTKP